MPSTCMKLDHCILLEYNNQSGSVSWWARQLGMAPSSLLRRLRKCEWDLEQACRIPPRKKRLTEIEYKGETHSIRQWAYIIGMAPQTLSARLACGCDIETALSTPTGQLRRKHKQ